jgi:general secretion pathway protein C
MRSDQKNSQKPWGQKWLHYFVYLFIGYATADLLIIAYRDLLLPSQLPVTQPVFSPLMNQQGPPNFQNIVSRNIFSSDGLIPDPLQLKNDPKSNKPEKEIPTLSSLPINLIGTLVHSNPDKSIAAIELKSKNQILSYTTKKDIDNLATVESIERGKVIIRNTNSGKLEYIELKSGNKVAFGAVPKPTETSKGDVRQVGATQFEISRKDFIKNTSDLSSILMQARAVPAKRPGTGEVYGWRLLDIQPGSIFTQLGLHPMDVICGVNGSPVTSPQQAMELYTALRSSNGIKLCIERDGKNNNFDYTISQ